MRRAKEADPRQEMVEAQVALVEWSLVVLEVETVVNNKETEMMVDVWMVEVATMELTEEKVCERHCSGGFPFRDMRGNTYFSKKGEAVKYLVKSLQTAISLMEKRLEELVGDFKSGDKNGAH